MAGKSKDEKKTEGAEKPKAFDPAEAKALFQEYEKQAAKVAELTQQVEQEKRLLSDQIEGICKKLGSNGPFTFGGKQLIASHKHETWFFKTKTGEAIVIE